MNTRVLPYSDASISEAAQLILAGETIAVPTETVYGLAADATNARAVARIYQAKGRPSFNPLIVHVPDLASACAIGYLSDEALALAEQHWPGPLTLVVPISKGSTIAPIATAGLPTIGLRVPAHPAMQALLRATGRPLAAPSANSSGSISPTRADHVLRSLGGLIKLIIDGGPTERGLESTIIGATGTNLRLLRPGPIEVAAIEGSQTKIEAPGQMASHYAPSKPLRLNAVASDPDEFLIGFGEVKGEVTLSKTSDLVEAAAQLFNLLHLADASPKPRIAIAAIPQAGLGIAINDRLRRASS